MAILIVGLGNPGREYELTRHNAGFLALDRLAEKFDLTWKTDARANADIIEANLEGKKVIFAKPLTFMNNSGTAVASLVERFKVAATDVWVVYDEAAIEPTQVRVRRGGSAGGHNGIKSIIAHIGEDFARIRIGVGSPEEHVPLENFVLQKHDNLEQLEKQLAAVDNMISKSIVDGIVEETVTTM